MPKSIEGDFGYFAGIGTHFLGSLLRRYTSSLDHELLYYRCEHTNEYIFAVTDREIMYYDWSKRKHIVFPKATHTKLVSDNSRSVKLMITVNDPDDMKFVAKLGYFKTFSGMKSEVVLRLASQRFPDKTGDIKQIKPFVESVLEFNKKYDVNVYPPSMLGTSMFIRGCQPHDFERAYKLEMREAIKQKVSDMRMDGRRVVNKFKKENPDYTVIDYRELYFDLKDTGTILDNYKDEIAEYTRRNVELIEKLDRVFGW